MTTDEISNLIVEKQKELKKAQENLSIVDQSILELEITKSKAYAVIKGLRIDIKILETEYWKAKGGM